jgi:hypothetical protein
VTLLQPRGELVAATVAAVARLGGKGGGRRWALLTAAAVLLFGAVAGVATQMAQRREAAAAAMQRDQAAAVQAAQLCTDGSHEAALQQLVALAAQPLPAPDAATQRDECAMRWIRDMRAVRSGSSERTFEQQVAVVQPVLLQSLATASGQRAADLRAHLGWGEYLRGREGVNGGDPVPHWQRALTEDAGNVYANAMWAHILMPRKLAQARHYFDAAVASGREREFVRRLQFGAALGGSPELVAYAVAVADEMRRGGEALPAATGQRLRSYAFGSSLLDPELRQALFAALPPPALLDTFLWLFPAARDPASTGPLERFNLGLLQARAGDKEAARVVLTALDREQRAQGESGRLVDQTRRELAALGPTPAR